MERVEGERSWQTGLRTGEYVREWKGFAPFYIGNFYGNSIKLGGEEEFLHCCDFFSGVGDVEWWIVSEINKLTKEQQDRMLFLMRRNKFVYNLVRNQRIIDMFKSDIFNDSVVWHRLGSYLNYEYIRTKLCKFVRLSHFTFPKIEELNDDFIDTFSIDKLFLKKYEGYTSSTINCNPVVRLDDIINNIAYVPDDILDIMDKMEIAEESKGYYLSDIKANTSDKVWLDSFKIKGDEE